MLKCVKHACASIHCLQCKRTLALSLSMFDTLFRMAKTILNANIYEPVSSKRYKLACALIEDSDQPPLSRSLNSLRLGALWVTVAKSPMFLQVGDFTLRECAE